MVTTGELPKRRQQPWQGFAPPATRLAALRQRHDLASTRVAEALGIHHAALSRIERGSRQPSFALLCRILEFYGVSFDEAFGDRRGQHGGNVG